VIEPRRVVSLAASRLGESARDARASASAKYVSSQTPRVGGSDKKKFNKPMSSIDV